MSKNYHHAFGCYGIIGNQDHIVVIKKHGGPYTNRYDLPGGSLENGEGLNQAVIREVNEETGLSVCSFKQIGVTSFKYPWDFETWHFNQHICVLYKIEKTKGKLKSEVVQFKGQDSFGAVQMPLRNLSIKNSSPLVMKAKEYLLENKNFNLNDQTFATWHVLSKPVF